MLWHQQRACLACQHERLWCACLFVTCCANALVLCCNADYSAAVDSAHLAHDLSLQCVVAHTLQVGEFMQDVIEDHFKKAGKVATVKYIDPSYMIRSVL
jgi:hypothetical protein